MRIRNRQLAPPKPVTVTIYREGDDGKPANIEFVCGAVLHYDEFDKLCPPPKPPLVTKVSTGEQNVDPTDRKYRNSVSKWSDLRVDWLMVQSLKSTPDLEWDTVKYDDPETWSNYESELKAFLTESEYNRIINGIMIANSPTENRRQEALDRFTRTQEAAEPPESTSQVDEPTTMPSSEPASV